MLEKGWEESLRFELSGANSSSSFKLRGVVEARGAAFTIAIF